MKEPFKVGDRVVLYNNGYRSIETISKVFPSGRIYLNGIGEYYPQQIRRLRLIQREKSIKITGGSLFNACKRLDFLDAQVRVRTFNVLHQALIEEK